MEKYIILKEENFEKVKYLIKVENEGYYIVVTKDTFHSLIENKFKK